MSVMASQITCLTIVYSTVYSGADQRKHQSCASLAFVRGIHRWPVNSPHKGPVARKMYPFDDVIMDAHATGELKFKWWDNLLFQVGGHILLTAVMMTSSNGRIFWVTGHLCGEFTGHRWIPHTQRPVTRSFDVFFDLSLNKRLSKQWWGWWVEMPSHPSWRHCSVWLLLDRLWPVVAKQFEAINLSLILLPSTVKRFRNSLVFIHLLNNLRRTYSSIWHKVCCYLILNISSLWLSNYYYLIRRTY